jgi:phosphohistidine phosphatase
MKTLVLCRHAKSDWPAGVDDIRRPLKARGVRDATYLGGLLARQTFTPDLILSSPAVRALTTAQIVAKCLGYSEEVRQEAQIYHGHDEHLIQLIRSLPAEKEIVMIFGHNPTMETAAGKLLSCRTPVMMPTSAMICLESQAFSWSHTDSQHVYLRWMLVPRLMRKPGED